MNCENCGVEILTEYYYSEQLVCACCYDILNEWSEPIDEQDFSDDERYASEIEYAEFCGQDY